VVVKTGEKISMRLHIVAAIIGGMFLLTPASIWGMIASNPSNLDWPITEGTNFVLSFGVSLDVESGDMTYTIQGPQDGGWKSELEWPLNGLMYMGGIVSARFWERFQLSAGIWKSLNDNAGTMKDSDWLYGYYGDEKAIYSESDSTVEAAHGDVNFQYNIFRLAGGGLGAMVGYSYTKRNWETHEGYQTTIDPYQFYVGPLSGTGVLYEEELQIPYLGVFLSLYPYDSAFGYNVYLLYSSIAKCEDKDDHVLRYKKSTGETRGTFFSLGGEMLWNFRDPWSVTGRLNYTNYDLEGEQDQYFYGGEDPPPGTWFNDIDMTIEGSQFSIGFMINYNLQ
jgi:outer membrane protease